MAPQPTMAIFTRPPSLAAAAVQRPAALIRHSSAHQPLIDSALALVAVLGREHEIAQKRLLVDAQQVWLLAFDVGTDEIPVGRSDPLQVTEGGSIPAPGQLELEKCQVVRLELGSGAIVAHVLGNSFAHSRV